MFSQQQKQQKTMRKSIFMLTVANFVVGILGISCKLNTESEANSDEAELSPAAIEEAKEAEMIDDMQAKNIAFHDSTEWNQYKKEAEAKIKANEKRITFLKMEIQKTAKKIDAAYLENINQIEKKNAELNSKVDRYTINTEDDWENFKKEIDKELDKLEKSIKEVAADKKN